MSNPRWVWAHGKRIEVEDLDVPPKAQAAKRAPKRKPFEIQWVKLPDYWIERLEHSRRLGTFKLAHRILREAHTRQHTDGREVVLSAAVTGLPRQTRWSATKEMVDLGLIQIQQKGNQAVRVIELLDRKPKRGKRGRNGQ